MKILDCLEELSKLAELEVDVDLLDMSLVKPGRITSILDTGAPKYLRTKPLYYLAVKERSLAVVLAEAQVVSPIRFFSPATYGNTDLDIWVASGGEAPQL